MNFANDEEILAMKAELAQLKLQESKLAKSQEKENLREKLEQQKARLENLKADLEKKQAKAEAKSDAPKLSICHRYNDAGCPRGSACTFVHMCRDYVYGKCEAGKSCGKTHDILHPDVKTVLEKSGINVHQKPHEVLGTFRSSLRESEKSRDDSKESKAKAGKKKAKSDAPKLSICHRYNGAGCPRGSACSFVHMCRCYADGKCEAGKSCGKTHNIFHPDVKTVLEKSGINTEQKPFEVLAAFRSALSSNEKKGEATAESKGEVGGSRSTKFTPQLGLCHRYNDAGCPRGSACNFVHMCRGYLNGKCEAGKACGKIHDISHPDVRAILEKNGVNVKQSPTDILADFRAALSEDASEKEGRQEPPKLGICHRYNDGGCPRGSTCNFIHMCKSYVNAKCESGRDCNKCHSVVHSDVKTVLEKNGINTKQNPREILAEFRLRLRGGGNQTSTDERKESTGGRINDRNQDASHLGICHRYNNDNCSRGNACPFLHVCKSFVYGKCQSGNECKKGHGLFHPILKTILEKHGIDTKRTQQEVLVALRTAIRSGRDQNVSGNTDDSKENGNANIPNLKVCFHYNGKGCEKGGDCMFLHMCKSYVESKCEQRGECSKNHDVYSADVKALLNKRGIDTNRRAKDVIADVRMAVASGNEGKSKPSDNTKGNTSDIVSSIQSAQGRRDGASSTNHNNNSNREHMICYFYVSRGNCRYGQSCFHFHSDLPYQWRWKLEAEETWKNVSCKENAEIERTFCDPAIKEYKTQLEQGKTITSVIVSFEAMEGKDAQGNVYLFQRMSTSSSVQFEDKPLTTVWVWYWKDELNKCKKYGIEGLSGNKANISSADLEQAYLNNPDGQLSFTTTEFEYTIDFSRMVQCNAILNTEREVFRRPTFVSEVDVRAHQEQIRSGGTRRVSSGQSGLVGVPAHWTMSPGQDILDHCQIVKIHSSSEEFKDIEAIFHKTLPSKPIKSIERIENGDLWWNYERKREKMLKKKSESQLGERRLFHGTRSQYVDPIWHQGFDFRLSGQTSGTVYGQGAYFALNARYSDSYSESGTDKTMFVAKVLTGEYVKGTSVYKRPPHKEKDNLSSELYDSCVNNETDPDIFVIFDNNQIYPEYLIRY